MASHSCCVILSNSGEGQVNLQGPTVFQERSSSEWAQNKISGSCQMKATIIALKIHSDQFDYPLLPLLEAGTSFIILHLY